MEYKIEESNKEPGLLDKLSKFLNNKKYRDIFIEFDVEKSIKRMGKIVNDIVQRYKSIGLNNEVVDKIKNILSKMSEQYGEDFHNEFEQKFKDSNIKINITSHETNLINVLTLIIEKVLQDLPDVYRGKNKERLNSFIENYHSEVRWFYGEENEIEILVSLLVMLIAISHIIKNSDAEIIDIFRYSFYSQHGHYVRYAPPGIAKSYIAFVETETQNQNSFEEEEEEEENDDYIYVYDTESEDIFCQNIIEELQIKIETEKEFLQKSPSIINSIDDFLKEIETEKSNETLIVEKCAEEYENEEACIRTNYEYTQALKIFIELFGTPTQFMQSIIREEN